MRSDLTDITVVLDRSGSMGSIRSDMEGALTQFVQDQKNGPGEAVFTLYQFDDVIERVHNAVPIGKVGRLTLYPRNMTALLDAMGQAITEVGARLKAMPEADRPEKVVFVTITDGLENASQHYTRDAIFAMIKEQQEVYRWEFLYMGANQDAIAVGRAMGINVDNAVMYAAAGPQVQNVVRAMGLKVNSYRGGVTGQVAMAWTEEERKAALTPDQTATKPGPTVKP